MFDLTAMKQSLHKNFGTCKCSCWNRKPIKVKQLNWLTPLVRIVLEHFVKKSATQYCRHVCYFKKWFILQFGNWNHHKCTTVSVEHPPTHPPTPRQCLPITLSLRWIQKKKFPFLYKLFITSLIQSGWLTSLQILTIILTDGQHFRLWPTMIQHK